MDCTAIDDTFRGVACERRYFYSILGNLFRHDWVSESLYSGNSNHTCRTQEQLSFKVVCANQLREIGSPLPRSTYR